MKVSMDTVVSQNKFLDSTDLDGEKVMMNINKGKYYGLNSVGSRIWELIDQPRFVKNIIAILLKEFNVDEKTCEDSVLGFLSKLYDEDLINIHQGKEPYQIEC
jgi:hypothetical protein